MSEPVSYVICGQCGAHNAVTDDFCQNDGYFLGHGDSRRVDPAPSGAPPNPQRPPAEPPSPRPSEPPSGPPSSGAATATSIPESVKPERGSAQAPPPRPRPDDPGIPPREAGQLICGSCGWGNAPARHFCRHCGSPLEDSVTYRLRWWQWRRRRRPQPLAGQRPAARRRRRFPIVSLLLIAVVVAAGLYFRSELVGAAQWTIDHTRRATPVNPVAITASSQAADHPPENAFDLTDDRSWQPDVDGPGDGSWIEAGFDHQVRLVDLIITPGASTVAEAYVADYRPRRIQIDATSSTGLVTTVTADLQDKPGAQTVNLALSDVTTVRVTSLSAFGRQGRLAVAELEFLTR